MPETFEVKKDVRFGALTDFTAKIIYRCTDGETLAVTPLKRTAKYVREGRRDVYLLTSPVLPEGRTGGEEE